MDSYIPADFARYIEFMWQRAWLQASAHDFIAHTSWSVNDELVGQVPNLPYEDLVFNSADALGTVQDRFLSGSDLKVYVACASKAIILTQPFEAVRGVANRRVVNLSFAVAVAYEAVPKTKLFAKRWAYRDLLRHNTIDVNELINFLNKLSD